MSCSPLATVCRKKDDFVVILIVMMFHSGISIYFTLDTLHWLCNDRRFKTRQGHHESSIYTWKNIGFWPLKIEPYCGMSQALSRHLVVARKLNIEDQQREEKKKAILEQKESEWQAYMEALENSRNIDATDL